MRRRGLVLADTHCGGIGGLTPPGYTIVEEVRTIQETFWKWFTESLERYAPFDFVLGLGDFTDGEGKKGTLDTAYSNVKKQAEAAAKILRYTEVDPKYIYLVRGTPFHSNGPCEYEDAIGKELGCSVEDTQKREIEGWKVHTRHVVGRSDISYGQATPILKELARMEQEAFIEGKDAPDIILRGHVHYAMSVNRDGRLAASVPCLDLPIASANGRRYMAWMYTVGFGILDLDEGIEPIYRPVVMPIRLVHKEGYECVKW